MAGYRRTGSRIAIQLIADQHHLLEGVRLKRDAVAMDYGCCAVAPIHVIQNRLIERTGIQGGSERRFK